MDSNDLFQFRKITKIFVYRQMLNLFFIFFVYLYVM